MVCIFQLNKKLSAKGSFRLKCYAGRHFVSKCIKSVCIFVATYRCHTRLATPVRYACFVYSNYKHYLNSLKKYRKKMNKWAIKNIYIRHVRLSNFFCLFRDRLLFLFHRGNFFMATFTHCTGLKILNKLN